MIRVESLDIGYPGTAIAEGVSFKVPQSASLLIMGHNGSGKSTLLKTLYALIPPIAGKGVVFGRDLQTANPRMLLHDGIRYLGQGIRSFDYLSIDDNRRILSRLYGFKGTGYNFTDDHGRSRIGDLSVGQRKLEALEMLSAGTPKAFFLDEPTAGLDVAHRNSLLEWIRARKAEGISFVIVEQSFRDLLGVSEYALVFRAGRVSYFGPSTPLMDEKKLASVFL